MPLFPVVVFIGLCCHVSAAPCPVIWNCPCAELVNGCYTCPCHDNGTQSVSTPTPKCAPVDFLSCPNQCIVLNNSTQCYMCNCTAQSTAPLVCYNCPKTSTPQQCTATKLCAQNELCHTRRITPHTENEYEFSCMSKTICDDPSSGTIIGRRSPECSKCCTTDLCNRQLCL